MHQAKCFFASQLLLLGMLALMHRFFSCCCVPDTEAQEGANTQCKLSRGLASIAPAAAVQVGRWLCTAVPLLLGVTLVNVLWVGSGWQPPKEVDLIVRVASILVILCLLIQGSWILRDWQVEAALREQLQNNPRLADMV